MSVKISLTISVVARLKLEVSAVLALFAVAIEDEDLLIREFQLAHDSHWIELAVKNDYNADLAVLIASQLLASILEGRAPRVLAYLEAAVAFDDGLATFVAFLVVCAANKS